MDSKIGVLKISTVVYNAILAGLKVPIKFGVNTFLSNGVPMNWVLEILDLDWIGLENSRLQPYDGYFIFYITPKWNIPKLMENFKDQIIALIENLGHKYDDLVNDTEIDQQELLNWFIV